MSLIKESKVRAQFLSKLKATQTTMFKLVVLSVTLALAAASPSGLAPVGLGWGAWGGPWGAPLAAPLVAAAPWVGHGYNYRGPLSLAPGQPASILAADGRPLDTLSVNLDRAAHYTARALDGGHLLKKRSVLAAPAVAWSHSSRVDWPAARIVAPVAVAAAPLAAIHAPVVPAWGLGHAARWAQFLSKLKATQTTMFKLVVLSVTLALAAASPSGLAPLGLGWGAWGGPWGAPLAAPLVAAAPWVGHGYNYRGPLSLAPGQPASILATDGRPLDTLSVNLDRAAHYTARALDGGHLLKKRSVLAAPAVAWSHSSRVDWPAARIVAPVAVAAAPLAAIHAPVVSAWGLGPAARWGAHW
ncbi:unnamed protein product [Leptidea sinapis]|uniref:Uncharacterized protein n=1 Tax=Leptidea sinapis TaxID=189913 RepID=A0A5E4QVT9_9NEOP|nr:unnamed protein product [Leptidea sinapis]